jgi:hypothetical protein
MCQKTPPMFVDEAATHIVALEVDGSVVLALVSPRPQTPRPTHGVEVALHIVPHNVPCTDVVLVV